MKHSIIMKVGENIVYQFAPHPKPLSEQSSSPVEFNRALPEWELTSKSYLIKKEDVEKMGDLLTSEKLIGGTKISYDVMEIYQDGIKEYARHTQTPDRTLAKTTAPVQQQQTFVAVQEIKKEPNGIFVVFEIDDSGEPMLVINDNKAMLPIEQKLFSSFIIKAIRDGIVLKKTESGCIVLIGKTK